LLLLVLLLVLLVLVLVLLQHSIGLQQRPLLAAGPGRLQEHSCRATC
jgi:preprotein translocase subunit SecG